MISSTFEIYLEYNIHLLYYSYKNYDMTQYNMIIFSIRFHNPSYDRRDEVAVILSSTNSNISPGEHEYVNPINDNLLKVKLKQ